MARKRREGNWWIVSSTGLEIGPFLCEADTKLAKQALALFREDLQWSIANKNEKERNRDDADA